MQQDLGSSLEGKTFGIRRMDQKNEQTNIGLHTLKEIDSSSSSRMFDIKYIARDIQHCLTYTIEEILYMLSKIGKPVNGFMKKTTITLNQNQINQLKMNNEIVVSDANIQGLDHSISIQLFENLNPDNTQSIKNPTLVGT